MQYLLRSAARAIGSGFHPITRSLQQTQTRGVSNLGPEDTIEQYREAKAEAYKALTKAYYDSCFFWEQPIVWGDQDSFQHVNNVRYVRHFESGRLYWMRHIGHRIGGPSVAETMIQGRDTLILAYRPVTSDNTDPAAFHLEASAFSLCQRAMVTHVKKVLVWYDYDTLKKCVPEDRYIQAVWNKEPAGSKIEPGQ